MIPSTNKVLNTDIVMETMPSKQHKMLLENGRIIGTCDDLEALIQTIFKILNTERYEYVIYSWNYGIELIDLYGQDPLIVCPELQTRIEDALLQDDRIQSVDTFEFDISKKGIVAVTFTVHTIYGDIDSEKVVNI